MRILICIFLMFVCQQAPVSAASEAIYGLEFVKIERVYDPNALPERLLLVSGALKLTGGLRGNVWEMVTYIPRRTAAPRSDRGHFRVVGNQMLMFSHLTMSTYRGRILDNGEKIVIDKVAQGGRTQTEVWYIVR